MRRILGFVVALLLLSRVASAQVNSTGLEESRISSSTTNFTTIGFVTAPTTATETLVSLTSFNMGASANSVGTSFNIGVAPRRFRIQSVSLAMRGSATATAATCDFRMKYLSSGAVTVALANYVQVFSLAVPATALAMDRLVMSFPETMEFPVGNSTGNWGITVACTYVTNAPSYSVHIVGTVY